MPVLHTHGARVSYTRVGIGEPVLLIQGVGAIGKARTPQVEALRNRFSVTTFDNRGIGASTITEGRLTIESAQSINGLLAEHMRPAAHNLAS